MDRAQKIKSAIQVLIGGHVVVAGVATYVGNDSWYKKWLMPVLNLFGPETAQNMIVKAAQYKLLRPAKDKDPPCLSSSVCGLSFSNPVGLAAGFDRHGVAIDGLLQMGFGAVEIGTVTPQPQQCSEKDRTIRLSEDKAIINSGCRSEGYETVLNRLQSWVKESQRSVKTYSSDDRNLLNENFPSPDRPDVNASLGQGLGIVGVNLGQNKESADPENVTDYVTGVSRFGSVADYLVINLAGFTKSGLRSDKDKQCLQRLIEKVVSERDNLPGKHRPPLLVKISPDIIEQDKIYLAKVLSKPQKGVDGIIICDTTVTRPNSLKSSHKSQTGGLSGAPLKQISTQLIGDMYKLTKGAIPIIGVGGVATGQDAYEKICAGASLVQLYTSLTFEGPPLVTRVKTELADILKTNGYEHISQAVGADFKSHKTTEKSAKT